MEKGEFSAVHCSCSYEAIFLDFIREYIKGGAGGAMSARALRQLCNPFIAASSFRAGGHRRGRGT